MSKSNHHGIRPICNAVDSLERRATPCGGLECFEFDCEVFYECEAGDVNCDGVFDSSDLVILMQHGKYESGEAADWITGDFTNDGAFDVTDLVFAVEQLGYTA